jgi:uncharacterized protein with FMN-binding domain
MPKRAIAAIITTALALVLLFSFKTPASSASALGLPGRAALAPGTSAVAPGTSAVAPGTSAAPAAPLTVATKGSGTFTGVAVQDPYGQVQVQVTMTGGKITDVTALQLPSQGRSGFISQSVAPILQGEAISAQSASIDTVSGATYTSQAYAQSLQSALDQAHA